MRLILFPKVDLKDDRITVIDISIEHKVVQSALQQNSAEQLKQQSVKATQWKKVLSMICKMNNRSIKCSYILIELQLSLIKEHGDINKLNGEIPSSQG